MVFDEVLLEPEQKGLLCQLVEAARNVPRDKRHKFLAAQSFGGDSILHDGLPGGSIRAYFGDIEILANEGLVHLSYGSERTPMFDVPPLGFKYYEQMKQQSGQPIQQVETEVRTYLNTQAFREKYPAAYQKWADAEAKLWASESVRELTTVGHLCREAMQDFADALLQRYQPPNVEEDAKKDKTKIIARVRAVLDLDQQRGQMGETVKPFLDALLTYWGTVSDLAQRQEHGAQKEGEPLVWEDARRLVFQTAVVMFEIDRTLAR